MTFDLFGDDPAPDTPAPATASRASDPERAAYPMTPAGLNRWNYKGEMLAKGMAVNAAGFWISAAMPEHVKEHGTDQSGEGPESIRADAAKTGVLEVYPHAPLREPGTGKVEP